MNRIRRIAVKIFRKLLILALGICLGLAMELFLFLFDGFGYSQFLFGAFCRYCY